MENNGFESYFFICNPAANTKRLKKKWPKVEKKIVETVQNTINWQYSASPAHVTELTQQGIDQGYKNIIAVGGDGIANMVLNEIIHNDFDVNLGFLGMGTSNDIQLGHGFPKKAVDSIPILLEGYTEKFGIGKLTGDFADTPHYFLDHADCGLSSIAAKAANTGTRWLRGDFKYTYYAIKKLTRFKRNPGTIRIDGDEYNHEFTVIAAGMSVDMSGYKLWPENHIRMGDFGIVFTHGQSRFQLLKLMLAAEKGKHIEKAGVEYLRGTHIEIELEDPWPFQAEGEIFADSSTQIQMTYLPSKINLITINPENNSPETEEK